MLNFSKIKAAALAAALSFVFAVGTLPSIAQQYSPTITLPTTFWINAGSGSVTFLSTTSITINYIASSTPPAQGSASTGLSLTANTPSTLTSTVSIWVQGAAPNTQVSVLASTPGGFTPNVQLPNYTPTTSIAGLVNGYLPGETAALSTTVTAIKANPGQLAILNCYNPNATATYVQIFDALTANVTLGTTTPKLVLGLPPTNANAVDDSPVGFQFFTGISYAATTTATGSTAPGTAVVCSYGYN